MGMSIRFRSIITVLGLLLCAAVRGQHGVDLNPRRGITFQKDSTFKLRFRMQNRFALFSENGDDLSVGSTDIRVRRMRLRFEGFVLTPKLQYKVQLGFSKADMDLVEGTTAQPVRDAVIWYSPVKHWTFGIGQTKLPGNRQRTISSGQQQLPERSIVNGLFTLDRDMGLFGTWDNADERMPMSVKAALTTGEGRGADPGDKGLCYTVRAEWQPLGAFTNGGDDFEGDLEREPEPKLAVAAGYSLNDHARRAGGQQRARAGLRRSGHEGVHRRCTVQASWHLVQRGVPATRCGGRPHRDGRRAQRAHHGGPGPERPTRPHDREEGV